MRFAAHCGCSVNGANSRMRINAHRCAFSAVCEWAISQKHYSVEIPVPPKVSAVSHGESMAQMRKLCNFRGSRDSPNVANQEAAPNVSGEHYNN